MLVLTRRDQESVILTLEDRSRIVVTVCLIEADSVRLGFTCDRRIRILREEVRDRVDDREHRPGKGGTS